LSRELKLYWAKKHRFETCTPEQGLP